MSDVFLKIKRLVMWRKVIFTQKATVEMTASAINREMVYEAVWNAPGIYKTIKSTNPYTRKTEKLYIIIGLTLDGIIIYTKGKIVKENNREVFYVFISSKKSD